MLLSANVFNEFKKNLCACYGYHDDGEIYVLVTTKADANAHKNNMNEYVLHATWIPYADDMKEVFEPAEAYGSKAYQKFYDSFPFLCTMRNKFYTFINGGAQKRVATIKEIDYLKNHKKSDDAILMTDKDLTAVNDGVTIGKLKDMCDMYKVLETRNKK